MKKKYTRKFPSGRGGARAGAGGTKKAMAKSDKRQSLTIRLPGYLVDRLRQTGKAGRIIESALLQTGFIPDGKTPVDID